MYIKFFKFSPKSITLFVRIKKRRFELEINRCINSISLHIGNVGTFSKQIFNIKY